LRSMAFSQPQKAPAPSGVRATDAAVYELLDVYADTEHPSQTQQTELLWHAHLRFSASCSRLPARFSQMAAN
jgi:hypothetical protein